MVKIIENYILSESIGQGNYGTVYKATHKINHNLYAVKVIGMEKFLQHPKLEEYISNEIETLTSIGSTPHIIKYYEKFKTLNNFYLVYEYCNGGNLFQLLKRQTKVLEDQALIIFRQLLQAFKVLNRYNIMHRDIKPENILFSDKVVKLADFGFCKEMKPQENMTKTMLGSPIYMAPEVLKGELYTSKSDIWSLGVILYEMIYGFCPYQSDSIVNLISTVDRKPLIFPSQVYVSEKTQTLIKRLLTKDYCRRISWVELFGIKIDETGHYVENTTNLVQVSNLMNAKSIHQSIGYKKKQYDVQTYQSFDQRLTPTLNKHVTDFSERKPLSLKKEDKKKVFYSQNYMNILEKPLERSKYELFSHLSSPSKEIDEQTYAQTQQPISFNELSFEREPRTSLSYQYIRTQTQKQRRQRFLQLHELCVSILSKTLKQIQKKGEEVLTDCYIILKKVHKKLKLITKQIKITEIVLLDMASVINYEIIQLDRLMIELRNQLMRLKVDIPQVEETLSRRVTPQLQTLVEKFKD